ncbi:hypothetical protein N431DRAFT_242062 [Stipitochalara longipes BDJ]|nr:hypothetical protein N431DRAFT_242062 [Stipitochalara longipes BDJ]
MPGQDVELVAGGIIGGGWLSVTTSWVSAVGPALPMQQSLEEEVKGVMLRKSPCPAIRGLNWSFERSDNVLLPSGGADHRFQYPNSESTVKTDGCTR